MKVFISWSGELSRAFGSAIRDWLPAVLQTVEPFFTPNDIEKGARWSQGIAQELEASKIGIFCLTKDNLDKPWLMFEAGALSKSQDASRVCPLLFGIDNSDLQGPLVQFQASPFSKTEMLRLVRSINSMSAIPLKDQILGDVFEMWWPRLEVNVNQINTQHNTITIVQREIRSDRDILEEVLSLARLNSSVPQKRPFDKNDSGPITFSLRHIAKAQKIALETGNSELLETIRQIYKPLRFMLNGNSQERTPTMDMSIDMAVNEMDILFEIPPNGI